MATRLELNSRLKAIIGESGTVYFQPPESLKITYPCFIYELEGAQQSYADNKLYKYKPRYSLTYISRRADSLWDDNIFTKLTQMFTNISYDRRFISDNLYHDVFELYF